MSTSNIGDIVNDLVSAYRKWKSSAYFDTFAMIDVKRLAEFEFNKRIRESDNYFKELAEILSDEANREKLFKDLIDQLGVRCWPKYSPGDENGGSNNKNIINNIPQKLNSLEKINYFIDLPVEAHILGVLWIMKCGYKLDNKLDEDGIYCYGNRIRKNIMVGQGAHRNPYLFYPYFNKYESWRDEALNVVEKLLDIKLNVVMVSLDIKGYYYNCRVDFEKLIKDIKDVCKDPIPLNPNDKSDNEVIDYLNQFIKMVFDKYTSLFNLKGFEDKSTISSPIIPIGFLPSHIIANWYLSDFDDAVREKINPQYYGRYVDDILMVFSVNDDRFSDNKDKDDILSTLLHDHDYADVISITKKTNTENEHEYDYEISAQYLRDSSHVLKFGSSKIKVFYFSYLHSRELIETFKETIIRHSSVFLQLHENDEDILDNFAPNIRKIDYSDSPQKIRSIESLLTDNFELSKWLSFLINFYGELSSQDKERIIQVLFETLAGSGYILHFNLWEKYLTFLYKHFSYSKIEKFYDEVYQQIADIQLSKELNSGEYYLNGNNEKELLINTLKELLKANFQKVFSLRNNEDVRALINRLMSKSTRSVYEIQLFEKNFREHYLKSYLFNTQIVLYPLIDYTKKKNLDKYDLLTMTNEIQYTATRDCNYLTYYPRYIHLHEIQMAIIGYPFLQETTFITDEIYEITWKNFWMINFGSKYPDHGPVIKSDVFTDGPEQQNRTGTMPLPRHRGKQIYKLTLHGNIEKDKIRIGIANVRVDFDVFESNLRGNSKFNRSIRNITSTIINAAINEKVDLLVMPECYIQHNWIGKLAKVARDHQMGMVFGLEHVIDPITKIANNYLVTLLPFKMGQFNHCIIDLRLKNYYSPLEIRYIRNYFLETPENKLISYTMYKWKGMCFVPFSCFEIASIEDRAIFKSKIDALVAVEWNSDVEYFSSIVESLSRDLHCYCIQVNSSEYGDNRITQPAKSHLKDLVRAKGGKNDFLIVDEIDIDKLRSFQRMGYDLQKEHEDREGLFKPTPPGFNHEEINNR